MYVNPLHAVYKLQLLWMGKFESFGHIWITVNCHLYRNLNSIIAKLKMVIKLLSSSCSVIFFVFIEGSSSIARLFLLLPSGGQY